MKALWIVSAVLVLLVLAFLGLGYYIFAVACRRGKALPWRDPEGLKSTVWASRAEQIREGFSWMEAHNAQAVSTSSADGLTLGGLWIPAEHPLGTIVLFHGYHSCPAADFSEVLDFYHRLGFCLLLPDQRAHGASEGAYTTFGVRESRDVLRWLSWLAACHPCGSVYLEGMSMGATTVLMASGEALPENVRGIVADCGFTGPWDIVCSQVRHVLHVKPEPFTWCANLFARRCAKFDFKERTTVAAVSRCRIPVLFFHGKADHFVPCWMSQAAYDACPGEKTLILVEGAAHGQSYLVDQPRCQSALENFFMDHLSN